MDNLIIGKRYNNKDFNNLKIVGGKIGSHKTSYVIKEAINGIMEDKKVLYFSTEEKSVSLVMRMVEILDEMKSNEEKLIHNYTENLLNESGFEFHEPLSLREILNTVEGIKDERESLIIIDSINVLNELIYIDGGTRLESVLRELDTLAKEEDLEIIVTRQLRRSE